MRPESGPGPQQRSGAREQGDGVSREGRSRRRTPTHPRPFREHRPDRAGGELRQLLDLYWVLEPDLRNLLLRLTPSAFDDRATWAIVMASTYRLQGDRAGPAPMRTPRYPHSRCGCAAPRTMRKPTCSGASRSRTWDARPRRSRRVRRPWRCCRSRGTAIRPLHSTPARSHLHRDRRAGQGAGPARAAAADPVLPVAGVAAGGPDVRSAAQAAAVPEAGGGNGVRGRLRRATDTCRVGES